jgi:hydrogenase maturation protein HypF
VDRRTVAVSGIVQGVGFRPFIHGLAIRFGLNGFVRNQIGGVLIEVEGQSDSLDRFLHELSSSPPPLAQIEEVRWSSRPPRGDPDFRIESSDNELASSIFVSADFATCDDCLRELFDHRDRRYRYPFLNCTNCGPRLSIIREAPYDRQRTTMAAFAMCAACRAEYEDPRDRRFHAQPIACPACGPRLRALASRGQPIDTDQPLALGIASLKDRKIVAIKGLGGYHLACLADDAAAVAVLRHRKHRDQKPLAIMVKDVEAARSLCEISPAELRILISPRRPIVLLHRHRFARIAEMVAPGNPTLGVMLPYTPLHHLILSELGDKPLVMTSGNTSDEPIAYEDEDAVARLAGIADLFLTHDRPIHLRCDDSVTRVVAGTELPLRRSRGYAPAPVELPSSCPMPILALGGQLKATFALGRGRHAFLSHHLGDLEYYEAERAYRQAVPHYERLFGIEPQLVVHDLHPDYATTRYAQDRNPSIARLAVQHHHAHVASCMADNLLDEPVIGVAFDGTGLGTDGAIWGGEFLTGGYGGFRRAAHLRYVPMPGGDQAIREPWRMAASYLADAGQREALLAGRVSAASLTTVRRVIDRRINTPLTSSAGRLFDGVAALLGVRDRVTYEGQAAIELEWLATAASSHDGSFFEFDIAAGASRGSPFTIDTRPLIAAIAAAIGRGQDAAQIARRFHSTLVEVIAQVCARLRQQEELDVVVLSGGVFQNALFTSEVIEHLERDGFRVYRHKNVPPGDGGLSLGQLVIAAATGAPHFTRGTTCADVMAVSAMRS